MGKKNIIIAEKPSVAQEYAKVLNVQSKDHTNGYIENDKWIVTWTLGHLVTMSYPEQYDKALKTWSLDSLPFLPDKYLYEIIKDVSKHKQFLVVKGLYNRPDIDCIYYAGDSGREGLYIQMLVRQEAGHREGVREAVVWIDSPTEDEILRGITQAKDISAYEHMKDAGYMRAIEDYLVGINFSRLLSVRYAPMLNSGSGQKKHKPISIGRVMTCVLGMIVRREREIRNFKPQTFYRISGKIHCSDTEIDCEWRQTEDSGYFQSPKLYSDFGFLKEADATKMINTLGNQLHIVKIEKEKKKKNAPLLFNLAELQGECSKRLHISPAKTLEIAQSLYEKKLTTYPRTDARVLSSAIALEIDKNLKRLEKGPYSAFIEVIKANNYSIKSKYVDDSKITDHYAIIPTGITPGDLSEMEKTVYDMICRRFLAVFYPPAEFESIKFEAVNGKEHFFGNGKYLSSAGFYDVLSLPNDEKSDQSAVEAISKLVEGSDYDASFFTKEGKTQSPNRYTTGSMILAMENAGTLIEDEELREQIKGSGIGTSATRAEVIDKLIGLNYIFSNDKTQILSPTNFGEMIYEVVDATISRLLEPKITAEWERDLDDIAEGSLSPDVFLKKLYDFVGDYCNKVKELENNDEIFKRIKPFASDRIKSEYKKFDAWDTKLICPICGKEIETTSWGFKCKGNISKDEGCNFSIGDIMGHRLLTPELKKLLSEGKCGPFYDFVSGKGKPFGAYLSWNDSTKQIDFDFVDLPWEKTEYKCPDCGKEVLKQGNYYKCVDFIDFSNGCKFFAGKILGKAIPDKQMEMICSHKRTDLIKGFKNKDGKVFDAYLEWNGKEHRFSFVFPTTDDMRTRYKCPSCGGAILAAHEGFRCENYKPADKRSEGGCSFYAGKICGHTIKEKELEAIVNGETTDLIEGFKPNDKDKKPFSARLKWSQEDGAIIFVFDENKSVETGLSCPFCRKPVIKNRFGYFCSDNKGRNEGCSFGFTSYLGVKLDDSQIRKLIIDGKTDLIEGFKSNDKSKKPFSAYLVLDKENGGFSLSFPERSENRSDFNCPVCHKNKLIKTDYSYRCECGFHMSTTIAEKKLSDEELRKLFISGQTDIISGFYSSRHRNFFSAKLKISGNEVQFEFPKKKKDEVGA
ncbi:MAG: topoisomerase C-terminal repeat-containing protein [Lachnospiraceae bacterium]|nr:topoisomerase C-terminal repeat-containing protein [Lachnospiraceae bacterium]